MFERLTTITALICGVLCVVLLAAPGVIFWLFQLDQPPAAEVMARRAGCLMLGLAVIGWRLRQTPPGAARDAVSAGLGLGMAALALLGLSEWLLGRVGPGIWLAILAETTLAVGYAACYPSRKALAK